MKEEIGEKTATIDCLQAHIEAADGKLCMYSREMSRVVAFGRVGEIEELMQTVQEMKDERMPLKNGEDAAAVVEVSEKDRNFVLWTRIDRK